MTTNLRLVPATLLRIFIGDMQEWQGQPLAHAVLDLARHHGIAWVIIWKGVEGFGSKRQVSTTRLPDLATNLPVLIDLIDREETLACILPSLDAMIGRGMITRTSLRMVQGREV